jgi:hypothetical protein
MAVFVLPASFDSFSSAANVASRVISAMSFNSAFFRSVRLFKVKHLLVYLELVYTFLPITCKGILPQAGC